MRLGKKLFENFSRRGEWVELLFMTVAAGLGFNVAKPWGESGRYDVATEHEGIFHRIQVKSTEMWLGTCYLCQLYAYGERPLHRQRNRLLRHLRPARRHLVHLPSQSPDRQAHHSPNPTPKRTQIRTLHGKLDPTNQAPPPTKKVHQAIQRRPSHGNVHPNQPNPKKTRIPHLLRVK